MRKAANPFLKVDRQSVLGALQAVGSRDPDLLYARKATLLASVRLPKLVGILLVISGVLVSLTLVGAALGIPLLLAGVWLWRRGTRNAEAVEAAYTEFVRSPAA